MSKVKYSDAPKDIETAIDKAVRVDAGFLPSPEYFIELMAKEKISLNVDKRTVNRFRTYAKRHNIKYQTLMNQVLSSRANKLQADWGD